MILNRNVTSNVRESKNLLRFRNQKCKLFFFNTHILLICPLSFSKSRLWTVQRRQMSPEEVIFSQIF